MGDIAHQFGFAEEVTYGTAVTPDNFLEFTSETLERRQQVAVSQGIKSGRRYGGQGRRITRNDAGGVVNFEVPTEGFGLLFEYLLGDVATTQPDATGSATVYEHTFTPGDLTDMSLTVQKGVNKDDGTVQAFTYPGSKIVSADFSIDQDGLLMCAVEFDSRQEETSTSLASASYTEPTIFTYSEGSLEVDDSAVAAVRSVGSLKIMNNLLTGRYFLGNSGLKSQPINVPFDQLTGSLDVEFQDAADFYDLFAADTSAKLELIFVGDAIDTAYNYELSITVADVRFEGETPKIGGPELVYQNIPFVGLDPSSGDAVTILYRNTETSIG
jgi:hypothetical protein